MARGSASALEDNVLYLEGVGRASTLEGARQQARAEVNALAFQKACSWSDEYRQSISFDEPKADSVGGCDSIPETAAFRSAVDGAARPAGEWSAHRRAAARLRLRCSDLAEALAQETNGDPHAARFLREAARCR